MQSTSLEAYRNLGRLGEKQHAVHQMILSANRLGYDMTDKELSRALKWEINTVTPRRNELVKMGLVVRSQIRECSVTGRRVIAWKVIQ